MSKIALPLTLLVAVLVCLLPPAPAQAQSIRTFVSTAGSDSNPCSLTQPCRHFQAAVNATSAGGEVDALDAGAYGSFTISQAISIEGQGWSYVAPPANGNAITITAGGIDTVTIHGVSLNGVGASNANGIVFNAGRNLIVTDCVAQNFGGGGPTTGIGILMQPTFSGGLMNFAITNTIVSNNAIAGIAYFPPSGSTIGAGVIDHVVASDNPQTGIEIYAGSVGSGGSTKVAISNSILSGNLFRAIDLSNGSSPLTVSIDNTSIVNNIGDGITAVDSTKVILGRSVITGNHNGINNATSPNNTFNSYQDNRIDDNFTDVAGPSLILLQPH
jgi:hypothetical protein